MVTLGVLSDTHIPDRARQLHPQILPFFRQAGVDAILHGGDVCSPQTLEQLAEVAPVQAVRGNRDWVLLKRLPTSLELDFNGVPLVLVHGHGRWWQYALDRVYVLLRGYNLERFRPRLQSSFPQARVIVFGHTHYPLNRWFGDQLLFNPGSPHCLDFKHSHPTIGLLHIHDDGRVKGEIVNLDRG